jgi:hypothetical protein
LVNLSRNGGKKPLWWWLLGVRDSFGGRRCSIIADARRALADTEFSEPEAVHEVRRALKRWRALLRLLARPLGEPADQMRDEARDLTRSLSGARRTIGVRCAQRPAQERRAVPAHLSRDYPRASDGNARRRR